MIQLTPERFGKENSQKIIGLQMASAYTGITLAPPLAGVLAARTALYPGSVLTEGPRPAHNVASSLSPNAPVPFWRIAPPRRAGSKRFFLDGL
jgi:hypothetical protein